MLIEFNVKNYKSFKDLEAFSMVAASIRSATPSLDEDNVIHVGSSGELTLLKSAAVYGANASGKSNFIKAINFMRRFVLNSSKDTQAKEEISVEPFKLSSESLGKPSFFEVVFLKNEREYRYGFEVDSTRVLQEWLYHTPKSKEALLFERVENNFKLSKSFEREGKLLVEKTRENALFLSVCSQFNGETSGLILDWFRDIGLIDGNNDASYAPFTISLFEHSKENSAITKFIKKLDLSISAIEIHKIDAKKHFSDSKLPDELKEFLLRNGSSEVSSVKTKHCIYNLEGHATDSEFFDLGSQESAGTKKLFSLAGPIFDALDKGEILVIDELDAQLHTLITREILKLFNSRTANPKNAQLIFTTHDTNLLTGNLLRRDQIWFAEKDKTEATHLYSLVEYKPRNDASFEKDYIQGRYGAIPYVGDLSSILSSSSAQELNSLSVQ